MAIDEAPLAKLAEDISKLGRDVEMLVRLHLVRQATADNKNQSDMIRELKSMGLTSGDIARYLGSTVKVVGTIAARSAKRAKAKRGAK